MTDSLTTNEIALASMQGWQLSPVYDARGYMTEAILPTDGRFPSAGHAYEFVWARAKMNDKLAQKALAKIAQSELAGKAEVGAKKRKKK